jgi:hypothetical protein
MQRKILIRNGLTTKCYILHDLSLDADAVLNNLGGIDSIFKDLMGQAASHATGAFARAIGH